MDLLKQQQKINITIIVKTYFFLINWIVHRAVIHIQGAPTVGVAQDTKEENLIALQK